MPAGRTRPVTLALGFAQFNEAFGPDLGQLRQNLAILTENAASGIYQRQNLNIRLSFALFLLATVVGLAISGFGSSQVVNALRRLVVRMKAVEEGQVDVVVPVMTHDEVGQLSRAFNHMIQELRERERIRETFGKFVDPRIVTNLISSTAPEQAERKILTVFFSDIKGFSSISEQITAASAVSSAQRLLHCGR